MKDNRAAMTAPACTDDYASEWRRITVKVAQPVEERAITWTTADEADARQHIGQEFSATRDSEHHSTQLSFPPTGRE
jgi:hypothetical protein